MSRHICLNCRKKRDIKFMQEIPEEIQIISNADNFMICKNEIKNREKSECLKEFTEKTIRRQIIQLKKMKDFKTSVILSSQEGQNKTNQYNLIDIIEEIEKQKKS